ncbi:MAG TPA: WhiB family transcriptional regulator [Trebonia sp.]|nr:WhiB family transcriptional regulator [Trebonia sp.]
MLPVASGVRSLGWMLLGACRQVDPDLFFPGEAATGPTARQVKAAKAVCEACTVRKNCLSYALEAKPEGIWGGTTMTERTGQRRRALRRQVRGQPRDPADTAKSGERAMYDGPVPAPRVQRGRSA